MGEDPRVALFVRKLMDVFPEVMRGIIRRQTDALSRGKITAPQYLVLDLLFCSAPAKTTSLAEEMGVSLPAMSGLVDRLYKMKLVRRSNCQADRRIIWIDITAKGREIVQSVRSQREKALSNVFGKLSQADREEYLRIITKMREILNSQKGEKGEV